MSKRTIYTCDICGKESDGNSHFTNEDSTKKGRAYLKIEGFDASRQYITHLWRREPYCEEYTDICGECSSKIRDFTDKLPGSLN